MPTTPTSTEVILKAILAGLKVQLPTLLAAAGAPAVKSWDIGERPIHPTTALPHVEAIWAGGDQKSDFGSIENLRDDSFILSVTIAGSDLELLELNLIRYNDCLVAASDSTNSNG